MRELLYICAPVRTATTAEVAHVLEIRRKAFALGWAPIWGPCLTHPMEGMGLVEDRDRDVLLEFCTSIMLSCGDLVIAADRITQGMEHELLRWLPNPIICEAALDTPDKTRRVLFEPGRLTSVLGAFERETGLVLSCKVDLQK